MTDRSGPPTWIFWVILSFVIVIVLVYLASTQLTTVGTAS
jgi:F0F1-type ATP synthase membrane subunit b/b'